MTSGAELSSTPIAAVDEGDTPLVHLRRSGVSVLVEIRDDAVPVVVHWGADVGDLAEGELADVVRASRPAVALSAVDGRVPLTLLPARADGHRGRPGLSGSRAGRSWSPRFTVADWSVDDAPDGGHALVVTLQDRPGGLEVRCELMLDAVGVLRLRHELTNTGDSDYELVELACVLPIPATADELLDLTGRWCRERHPQRRPIELGTWLRESRHGRTGHDNTLVLAAGTHGFGNRHGSVWALHLGWSGDAVTWCERLPATAGSLGAAELFQPGEKILAPGERCATPWAYGVFSESGLDGVSDRFHRHVRARPQHPRSPRPVVINTWEAVYFDHDIDRLRRLADVAAEIGVERFVLDDGWFRHRRNDAAGLGDWYVDENVWPDGLHPLVDHVTGAGMQFGLWVEPEMVNPDSDLARAHAEWISGQDAGRLPVPWRHQQVLDLVNPEAWNHVLERLDALLTEYDISYLKWDHNRDLIEAAHDGRPAVHEQTLAVYRLLDELRRRHPCVEIESCSSGGGRVDLGILERTDRVWPSDTNDPLERTTIQRWTGVLLPPELMGSHIGPAQAHTTGRVAGLAFRVATAVFGHLGIEWDITSLPESELAELAEAIRWYKRWRPVLHGGTVVNADHPDPAATVHGVVSADRSQAVVAYAQTGTSAFEMPVPMRVPGLDPQRRYRVRPVNLAGGPTVLQAAAPPWLSDGGTTLTGRALDVVGVSVPVMQPENAMVFEVISESTG
jgi:alpha-galactosidase